jgi:hypothetical protein
VNGDARTSCAVFWQLAFWPPDREIVVYSKRPWAPRIVARLQILELTVLTLERLTAEIEAPSDYPCTYPGCARGPAHPMESATQLANHRFAAHGIRSTNEESIKRQQRRDKHRAEERGIAPEYIDRAHIRSLVGTALPAPAGATITDGALNPGEREHVRRRLVHFIGTALPREVHRSPAEICLAVAEIAAAALVPTYPKIVDDRKADVQFERLTQLFTKSAVAV